jgi:hypothetical protein
MRLPDLPGLRKCPPRPGAACIAKRGFQINACHGLDNSGATDPFPDEAMELQMELK